METSPETVEQAILALDAIKQTFASLSPGQRSELLTKCIPAVAATAQDWVKTACRAKGPPEPTALIAEEWVNGPAVTLRFLRLMRASLTDLAGDRLPRLPGPVAQGPDGRLQVPVLPTRGLFDALNFMGFRAHVRMLPEVTPESLDRYRAASLTRPAQPGVSLVLGAGNVSSIPVIDVLSKLFQDGQVVLLKMNPVNAYLGPIFEQAFQPLVAPGFVRIVYGGGEVGAAAVTHPRITSVHITGSMATHDAIVWGPPGEARQERKQANLPVLQKPITSELGNVSPWIVVPGHYSERQLKFQAENIAASIVNNASFNCVATKLIVTSRNWSDRERFLDLVNQYLTATPRRRAYYPGALQRFRQFTANTPLADQPVPDDDTLPWTLLRDVDPETSPHLFREESFVCVCAETALAADTPMSFLARAVDFVNERAWGTLSAAITIPERLVRTPEGSTALQEAIARLRYGAVAVNH